MERKIIHCDADCFFAALEMRNDSSLRNRPMAVGGSEIRRGVISTCNYEARRFGVRSAMPSAHAKRLCPDLIIVPPNMNLYKEASQQIREIFRHYTDRVEPLSLDEAFLDVTQSNYCRGSATLIAKEIREKIQSTLAITVSAGVAPNKFIAKVASDWKKPNGLTVITPEQVPEFVRSLPIERIYGVGKVTAAKLHRLGIKTCGDLQQLGELELSQRFGSMGIRLHQLCRGEDDRPVQSQWRRQSLSVEHTYDNDLPDLARCQSELPRLYEQLEGRLARLDSGYRVAKAFIKVKFADFSQTTLERLGTGLCLHDYQQLCSEAWQRGGRPVRLLGLGVRLNDSNPNGELRQLALF